MPRWLLPESVADVLPSEARQIEDLRRHLLDLYRTYGYELVIPPLIEHLDSLLTGSGTDLGSRTFQIVDQLSGRTLGIRADMTPQVARIDAHLLNRQGVARFCYAGSVLHTLPQTGLSKRELFQVGGEIYGHAGLEADLEALELVVESILVALPKAKRNDEITLDLCHYGIALAIISMDESLLAQRDSIHDMLVQKDSAAITALPQAVQSGQVKAGLLGLLTCYGSANEVLVKAQASLPQIPNVLNALADLRRLVNSPLWARFPQVRITIDLADVRGYGYHNGVGFAAYMNGFPAALARGGRYDNVGKAFGRARPATGFSLELRDLIQLSAQFQPTTSNFELGVSKTAIRAPWSDDEQLLAEISKLRRAGEIVVQVLPGHEHDPEEFLCDRELQMLGDVADRHWRVTAAS
jgi:ATP phosphoribosyltransferase regulatory subunit